MQESESSLIHSRKLSNSPVIRPWETVPGKNPQSVDSSLTRTQKTSLSASASPADSPRPSTSATSPSMSRIVQHNRNPLLAGSDPDFRASGISPHDFNAVLVRAGLANTVVTSPLSDGSTGSPTGTLTRQRSDSLKVDSPHTRMHSDSLHSPHTRPHSDSLNSPRTTRPHSDSLKVESPHVTRPHSDSLKVESPHYSTRPRSAGSIGLEDSKLEKSQEYSADRDQPRPATSHGEQRPQTAHGHERSAPSHSRDEKATTTKLAESAASDSTLHAVGIKNTTTTPGRESGSYPESKRKQILKEVYLFGAPLSCALRTKSGATLKIPHIVKQAMNFLRVKGMFTPFFSITFNSSGNSENFSHHLRYSSSEKVEI